MTAEPAPVEGTIGGENIVALTSATSATTTRDWGIASVAGVKVGERNLRVRNATISEMSQLTTKDSTEIKPSKAENASEFREAMQKKYNTVHWDKICTDAEWQRFLKLTERIEEIKEEEDDA